MLRYRHRVVLLVKTGRKHKSSKWWNKYNNSDIELILNIIGGNERIITERMKIE